MNKSTNEQEYWKDLCDNHLGAFVVKDDWDYNKLPNILHCMFSPKYGNSLKDALKNPFENRELIIFLGRSVAHEAFEPQGDYFD